MIVEGPVSENEFRCWRNALVAPGRSSVSRLRTSLPVPAGVDDAGLTGVVQTLIDRSDILRTSFVERGDTVVALVEDRLEVVLRDGTFERSSSASPPPPAARGFGQADLARISVVERSDGRDLEFDVDHTISDGWSVAVLRREVRHLLAAAAGCSPPSEPRPRIDQATYREFARLEQESLRRAGRESKLMALVDHMSDQAQYVALPRPQDTTTSTPGRVYFLFDHQDSDRIRQAARAHRATPFSTLATLFLASLAQVTGVRDFVVFTAIANRPPRWVDSLGYFANLALMTVSLPSRLSFAAAVEVVQAAAVRANHYSDVPVYRVLDELLRRGIGRRMLGPFPNIVFQYLLTGDVGDNWITSTEGGRSAHRPGGPSFETSDLEVNMAQTGDGRYAGNISYSAAVDKDFAADIPLHMLALLAAARRDPERAFDDDESLLGAKDALRWTDGVVTLAQRREAESRWARAHWPDIVPPPFALPDGEAEQAVARIVKEVAGVEDIGRHDDLAVDVGLTLSQIVRVCTRARQEGFTADEQEALAVLKGSPSKLTIAEIACTDRS
jgi:hypothetical protein